MFTFGGESGGRGNARVGWVHCILADVVTIGWVRRPAAAATGPPRAAVKVEVDEGLECCAPPGPRGELEG